EETTPTKKRKKENNILATEKKLKVKKKKKKFPNGLEELITDVIAFDELEDKNKKKKKSEVPQTPMFFKPNLYSMFNIKKDKKKKKLKHIKFLSFNTFKKNYLANKDLGSGEFKNVAQRFVDIVKKDICSTSHCIGKTLKSEIFNLKKPIKQDYFFGQKILLDKAPEIAFHGDVHGDIDSLIAFVEDLVKKGYLDKNNPFKIIKKNFYLVFLGDYVDRGDNSFEVLYLLLRLKIENPSNVILIRGNHEDIGQNNEFGYLGKLGKAIGFNDNVKTIYNMLPSFVFIGTKGKIINYSLFCHGGLEPRFNPHAILSDKRSCVFQWIDKLDISWLKKYNSDLVGYIVKNAENLSKIIKYPSKCKEIGFLWSDFIPDTGKELIKQSYRGKGMLSFGRPVTLALLNAYSSKSYKVKTIFRGHQHSDPQMGEMLIKTGGFYNSWATNNTKLKLTKEFPVWTLNVSPNNNYNGKKGLDPYDYDTYAILKMGSLFANWKLKTVNLVTPKKKEL
ncbi:metallophosphoesterase family protein, partial [Candidatus Dependentiae bacterium]